jgi:hypothetical protein
MHNAMIFQTIQYYRIRQHNKQQKQKNISYYDLLDYDFLPNKNTILNFFSFFKSIIYTKSNSDINDKV